MKGFLYKIELKHFTALVLSLLLDASNWEISKGYSHFTVEPLLYPNLVQLVSLTVRLLIILQLSLNDNTVTRLIYSEFIIYFNLWILK